MQLAAREQMLAAKVKARESVIYWSYYSCTVELARLMIPRILVHAIL